MRISDWSSDVCSSDLRSVIGASEQGRPLHMLALGNPDAREVLLVLGRQHPPETTGTQALMGFVDELAADSPLARDFRERTLVIVLPLLNPDGVVEGRSEEHTSELQTLMRNSYAVFCLKKKK